MWWRRAVLPSLPWRVCFLSFCFFSFLQARGQLGHGDQQEQQLPKEIAAFAGRRVVAVSAVVPTTASPPTALAVWSWGYGFFGRLGLATKENQLLPKKIEAFAGRRVIAATAGLAQNLALTADDAVFTWGEGGHGCLARTPRGPVEQAAAKEGRSVGIGSVRL